MSIQFINTKFSNAGQIVPTWQKLLSFIHRFYTNLDKNSYLQRIYYQDEKRKYFGGGIDTIS
jgi:hypothetical protein